MDFIKETQELLHISPTQFADLFGISYTDMSDIMEGQLLPSDKLIKGCKIAREIFLHKNNT